jgi:hypothetical protein
MARLTFLPHRTAGYSAALEHQINTTHAGQAHFANTGPFGATCGECVHLGYFRQVRSKSGDVVKAVHHGGCAKFHQFTNKHGPVVPGHAAACRHFERKEDGNG